jgi:hypothetical protein
MLIGSNSNFFQTLNTAGDKTTSPTQSAATQATSTNSSEKFANQQKGSLVQAESGKGAGLLSKVTGFLEQVGGGDPGKKTNKIRSQQPLDQSKNAHQAVGELFNKFANDTNHYAAQIRKGNATDLTDKGVAAFKTPISREAQRMIKQHPEYLTEYLTNPQINRNDMLQHNFSEDGKTHLSREMNYSDLFPTAMSETAFLSWVGKMFEKDPALKETLEKVTDDRKTNPPNIIEMGNIGELLLQQKINEE